MPANTARIRMYRTGLGDCFLLTFPGKNGTPFQLLVDCGVFKGTHQEVKILRQVAADIRTTTRRRLDVLVATHEHYDHLIGFKHARDIFEDISIGEVWLSWAEKPGEPRAAWLRTIENKLKTGLQLALSQAMADSSLAPRVAGLQGLLEFGGNPLAADYSEQMGEVKRWLRDSAAPSVKYLEPHAEPIDLVPGVRVYTLGPPVNPKFFRKLDDTKANPQTYGSEFAFSAVPAFLAAGGSTGRAESSSDLVSIAEPFEQRWKIDESEARKWKPDAKADPFFQAAYGFKENDASAWRRLDNDWLADAENLALQLDSLTNNSSLALAIEVGASRRVILMAGDAQVGNWLSWHDKVWTITNQQGSSETVTAAQLLGRTVLYKVGHHGSHNATLKDKGLELMTSDELVAMIPVDQAFANNTKHWKMPFPALLTELTKRTKGRVIRADRGLPAKGQVDREARVGFFARAKAQGDLFVDYHLPF